MGGNTTGKLFVQASVFFRYLDCLIWIVFCCLLTDIYWVGLVVLIWVIICDGLGGWVEICCDVHGGKCLAFFP